MTLLNVSREVMDVEETTILVYMMMSYFFYLLPYTQNRSYSYQTIRTVFIGAAVTSYRGSEHEVILAKHFRI